MTLFRRRRDFALPSVDTLHVAAWTAKELPEHLILTRFMMPVSAHDVLVQWCREKTGRAADVPTYMAVAGLSEVLSFLVPETAYMVHDRDPEERGSKRQCLFFLGDILRDSDLRNRLRSAILIWLGILYPDKEADSRSLVAEAVLDERNWCVRQIQHPSQEPQRRLRGASRRARCSTRSPSMWWRNSPVRRSSSSLERAAF